MDGRGPTGGNDETPPLSHRNHEATGECQVTNGEEICGLKVEGGGAHCTRATQTERLLCAE